MRSGPGEIAIQTTPHPNPLGRWITFEVTVASTHELAMVLDSGAPLSAISPETAARFADVGLLREPWDARYEHRLSGLTSDGQSLPDLQVRVLRRLTGLQIMGLVGLDFLEQFAWIRFHVPTRRLFLELP